ncbi:hypothetical protein M407DRAFT_242357 [Tulasnella calospora MUT 4182]|uniref:Uncharacterized protein n=1 Tax=Tulasnella calospora MUT 4182 TaxID=1051891 RepID=A0A0C3QP56_9AGAM|nr:hypothetical protein M407DRAFT_242357 [Tulasnella calospora MUT 4182]
MDGEWGRCAEYLRTSNSRLQDAVEEKAQIVQKFQLVGQFIDQMRNGHSALSQLTATQPTAAFDGPPSSTAPANSKPSF